MTELSGTHLAVNDGAKSLRELQANCWKERWFGTYEGGISAINAYFCQVEEEFLAERDAYPFPDTYDLTMLQIHRNSAAGQLLTLAKSRYEKYILARSKMPLELPELPKTKTEKWLDERIREGKARGL